MKSKTVNGLLDSRRRLNEQGTEYHYDDVLDIIELAEQDAEERAVKAFDQWCRRVNKRIDKEIHKQVILEFKQLLNGGQGQ